MEIYCDTCETAFDVSVSSHDCSLVLKKRLYNERKGVQPRGPIKNHTNHQIVLPENLTIVDIVEKDLKEIKEIINLHSNQRSCSVRQILQRDNAASK